MTFNPAAAVVAVATTRNEEASVRLLVNGLMSLPEIQDVIIVDEESSDLTRMIASSAGAMVIPHAGGIGPCLMKGWEAALNMGARRIVQIDAGGSHDTRDVPGLLGCDADLVIGSRFVRGAKYTGRPMRAAASRATAWACSAATLTNIRDWTSGFRVFKAGALEALLTREYHATMHGWQIEVLGQALDLKLAVAERPIHYRAGRSSMNRRIAVEAASAWWELLWP